jgi:isocitrate dehydrogenase
MQRLYILFTSSHKGERTTLKAGIKLLDKEIFDASLMDVSALETFIKEQILDAKASGVLLSLHMKATMMKVSDPIIFGHVIRLFFSEVFENYKTEFEQIGVNPNNGYENILDKLKKLDPQKRSEIEAAFNKALEDGPDLAMVNSEKGITNLHVPSDVIIDASMPAMIRTSGKMYNAKGLGTRHQGYHSR